jgi:hypothetical protein
MNEGAKAGIDFLHSLPEPVQFVLYVACIVTAICLAVIILYEGCPMTNAASLHLPERVASQRCGETND